jgi:hypothetical protein
MEELPATTPSPVTAAVAAWRDAQGLAGAGPVPGYPACG